MADLQPEQLSILEARLRDERGRLEVSLAAREGDQAGEDAGDAQDLAADHADRSQRSQLLRRAQDRLHEVLGALGRLDAGTFGICEESGDRIPFARLSLDPVTRYTVDVQEELEEEAALRRADVVEEEGY